jgi:hypothetical protein
MVRTSAMHQACAAALVMFAVVACRPTERSAMAEARVDESPEAAGSNGVAVVELFTSEGCSSCPPADGVLGELAAGNRSVYALSFHVDYWDDLGWPDRFASPEYTARQRSYARSFGGAGLYTPQMIVNGVEPFTGSDRARAERNVLHALAHAAQVPLAIRVRAAASHSITVDYDALDAPADALIEIALVEHAVSSDVHAGENAGRRLDHTNVVRAFEVLTGASKGSTLLHLPASLRPLDAEVIAYVQRPSAPGGGMPVLGATHAPLPR